MTFNIGWDTSTNKEILKSQLRELFDSTDREALVEYQNVTKEIDVSDYYERFARQAGLEGMEELADGGAIPLADPVFDDTKDLTQIRYGLGFKITSGMKKFNKWNEMQTMTKNLGMVMRESKDVIIARMFNNPTSTTYATGWDSSKGLADNAHVCLDDDATTYDNRSAGALGTSTLESALIYFDTMVDDMGMAITATPTKLVVNPQLRITSMELLGGELKPYTGDNTVNAFPDWDLKPFIYHRLTSATSWFVIADNDPDYKLMVLTSQKPDMKIQDSPDTTRSTIVTSEQWFKYGFTDPRRYYLGNV